MAKLKAPLLSLGAAGQLGKTIVYFGWKGLNVAREYVVPANPKTLLQDAQRDNLTLMVAAIHTAQARDPSPLNSDDQVAYSALAAAKGKIMTWFNMAVKMGLDALRLADGYTIYSGGATQDTDKDDFRVVVYITDDGVTQVAAGKFYLGTSKTNLIQSEDGTVVAGNLVSLTAGNGFSGLTAGRKYFWQFRPDAGDPCEGSDSGIYYGYAT